MITLACTRLALIQGSASFAPADPSTQGMNTNVLSELSERVEGFISAGWVVGAELLVIRNRCAVLHRVYGHSNREADLPMERGILFNLRSMAKPIVGSIAQRFIDSGTLSLSDPVGNYIPSFRKGASALITIEHLLTHTSGLPDGNPAGRPGDYPTLKSIADYLGEHGVGSIDRFCRQMVVCYSRG